MIFEDKYCADEYWPVYKGESFDIWNPDTGLHYAKAKPQPALDWLQAKRLRAGKSHRDSPHREFPMAYLQNPHTLPCFAPRIAFRDVTNAIDRRTIIACLLPPKIFITHLAPYFLWPRGDEKDQAFLLGVLCSIPLDWYARRFVGSHLTYFVLNPFPIPRPNRDNPKWRRVVELAGRLACPDDRFAGWAKAVGVECGRLKADEKEDMIYELDAVVAHLYGINKKQLIHIFKTFREGWDYNARLSGVRRYFQEWSSK